MVYVVTNPVTIGIICRVEWASVASVANAVAIRVLLVRINDGRTVVTSITDTVSISVFLARIGRARTIVDVIGNAIAVTVGCRSTRAERNEERYGFHARPSGKTST